MMMDDGIRRRLRAVLQELEVNWNAASQAGGLASGYLSQMFGPKKRGRIEGVIKILKEISPESIDYVVHNKGEPPAVFLVEAKNYTQKPNIRQIDLGRDVSDVPLVGIAGAGMHANIEFSTPPGELGYVRLPPGGTSSTVAVEVRGVSMRGTAENGWFVYYDLFEDGIREDNVGELCVVQLEDGQTLVKTVQPSRESGRFDLESTNAPTIRGVRIAKSAFVTAILPPRSARKVLKMDG